MGLIKWEYDNGLEGYAGIIGEQPILEVTAHDSTMFGVVVCDFDRMLETTEDFDREKKKLTGYFTEWLKAAGLVQRPESCGYCKDSGATKKGLLGIACKGCEQSGPALCSCLVLCPCTKDPNSLYSFIKEIKGGCYVSR